MLGQDTHIFGDGGWVHLDFNGKYESENASGDEQARVVLKTRSGGLIEGVGTSTKDGTTENTVLGLVRIAGGSGKYFLAVDRSGKSDGGEVYLIARLTDGNGLDIF